MKPLFLLLLLLVSNICLSQNKPSVIKKPYAKTLNIQYQSIDFDDVVQTKINSEKETFATKKSEKDTVFIVSSPVPIIDTIRVKAGFSFIVCHEQGFSEETPSKNTQLDFSIKDGYVLLPFLDLEKKDNLFYFKIIFSSPTIKIFRFIAD